MASEKITNILDLIDALSILELSELVDGIQEKYGVTAAVAAAPAAGAGAAHPDRAATPEKDRPDPPRFLGKGRRAGGDDPLPLLPDAAAPAGPFKGHHSHPDQHMGSLQALSGFRILSHPGKRPAQSGWLAHHACADGSSGAYGV